MKKKLFSALLTVIGIIFAFTFCCCAKESYTLVECTLLDKANSNGDNKLNESYKVYLDPSICTDTEYVADVYGKVIDKEGQPLDIKREKYTFAQFAGNVWTTELKFESSDKTVVIYLSREVKGSRTGIEQATDIYGNNVTGEIGEGYGNAVWLTCFTYSYL